MSSTGTGAERSAPGGILRFAPEGALLLTTLFWAGTSIILKDTFTHIAPMAYTFVRFPTMVLLGILVLAVQVRRSGIDWRVERADWPRMALSGLTGFTLYQICYAEGLARTTAFAGAVLVGMAPLFTIIIVAFMGERPSSRAWVGVLVGLVGAIVFIAGGRTVAAGSMVGNLLSVGAGLMFAIYQVVNRPVSRKYPSTVTTAWTLLLGTIPLTLWALPAALAEDWSAVPSRVWISLIYMVIFPVYVAYILWNYGIRERGVALASSFGLLTPVFSGIGSVILLHEPLGALRLFGAALVLAGLAIPRLKRKS